MNKKQVIRLNETQLNRVVKECLKLVLKETKSLSGNYGITKNMLPSEVINKMKEYGIYGCCIKKPNYLPKQWLKKQLCNKNSEYVYNVENLINNDNIVKILSTGTDTFFGVDKNGNVYANHKPDKPIGNLKTDKIYGTGAFGDYCWLMVYQDGKQSLFNHDGILRYGKWIKLPNEIDFFAEED